MNVSLLVNITQGRIPRDSFSTAVARNVIVVGLCISINYINGTLVHTFSKHEIFTTNPRYILYIHMVLNDMIQLMVAVLLHVLSYIVFVFNVSLCCILLMMALFTTVNTPLNLGIMAVERYVAICNPQRSSFPPQLCPHRDQWVKRQTSYVLGDKATYFRTLTLPIFHKGPCVFFSFIYPCGITDLILSIQTAAFKKQSCLHQYCCSTGHRLKPCVMNSTGGQLLLVRDSFATAFMRNSIVVLIWCILSYINISVVATFFKHQIFYEDPRYILFIHMVINDAVQLTVTIALFVVSYVLYTISVGVCSFIILVAVFTTRSTPVNLAGMAIERYIAICYPLRHAQICTVRRAYVLIGAIWFVSVVPDITDLFVTLAKEPLSFFQSRVFCLRENVFRDPVLLLKRQVFDGIYFSLVFLTLLCTYLRIVFAAHALSTERTSAKRATNTIMLHGVQLLMCLLSYISPSVEGILHIIFPGRVQDIRFANYIIVYILPRFLSPIIYGVRDKKFRKYLRRFFVCGVSRRVEGKDEED